MPKVGLVLGAGGFTGHAYHCGVLAGLEAATGWDSRDATLILGTSAGSGVGALLRAGLNSTDLAAAMTSAEPKSRSAAGAPSRSPSAAATGWLRGRIPAAPALALRAALPPWAISPGAVLAGMIPSGVTPADTLTTNVTRHLGQDWPEGLWVTAVSLDTGRLEVFGRAGTRPVPPALGVTASCAVAGVCAPVLIDGERFIDGGFRSPTNADLFAGEELDLVVVSAPMAGTSATVRAQRNLRGLFRTMLYREVRRLRRAGIPVLTLLPAPDEATMMGGAIGLSANGKQRRAEITLIAKASVERRIERLADDGRLALLA